MVSYVIFSIVFFRVFLGFSHNHLNKDEKGFLVQFWYPKVWKEKYKPYYFLINEKFINKVYVLLHGMEIPRIFYHMKEALMGIRN